MKFSYVPTRLYRDASSFQAEAQRLEVEARESRKFRLTLPGWLGVGLLGVAGAIFVSKRTKS